MPLDPSYLTYSMRRKGMDHDLYPSSNLFKREPVEWPGGKKLALWISVAVEFFPITPNDGPFRAPGHMVTPFPDYRTFTTRDYGNRVGVYRIMDALNEADLAATAFVSSAHIERAPALVSHLKTAGWELAAHGVDMNRIHYGGLSETDEKAAIDACLQQWKAAGATPSGWMSPGRSQSDATLDLLKGAGLQWTADWGNDDMPYQMANGLTAMPYTDEIEDRKCIVTLGQREEVWAEQVLDAADWLSQEADAHGGRILHLALTPYVIGQPFRIKILQDVLGKLKSRDDIWSATGGKIFEAWRDQQ